MLSKSVRNFSIFVAVIILTTATTAQLSAQVTVEKYLASDVEGDVSKYTEVAQALEAFKMNDAAKTAELLKAASEKFKELPPSEILMARLLVATNQRPTARAIIQQAADKAPSDPEAFVILGEAAILEGRPIESKLLYQEAQQLLSNYTANDFRKNSLQKRTWMGMATLAEAKQDWESAEQYLRLWLEADKENPAVYRRLGVVFFQRENFKAAEQAFSMYKKYEEDAPFPEILMGQLHHSSGNADEAKKFMTAGLQKGINDAMTLIAVGRWYLETGDAQQALKLCERAEQSSPDNVEARLLRGIIARYQEDHETAEIIFREIVSKNPTNAMARNHLSRTLIASDDSDRRRQALQYAQMNLQGKPDLRSAVNRESVVTLAWVLFQLGNVQKAEQAIQLILNRGAIGPEAAYYTAAIFKDRGRGDIAKQILTNSLKTNGLYPHRQAAEKLLASLK